MAIYGFDGTNKQRVQVPDYQEFKASEVSFDDYALILGAYAKIWCYHSSFTVENWTADNNTTVTFPMPQSYQDAYSASSAPENKFKVFASWRGTTQAVVVNANPGATQISITFRNMSNETLSGGDFDLMVFEHSFYG